MQKSLFAQRAVPAARVLIRELDGESVILDLNSQCYFGLDEVGTRMWTSLAAAPTIAAAMQELLAEYDVGHDRLEHDLAQFIEQLAGAGLIELVDA